MLGTTLIAWIKEEGDDIGIARRVVEAVWLRVCPGRAQVQPDWTTSCETKLDLIQEIEIWVRMNSARCERHLIKLGYRCPKCQHGMCIACNEIEWRIQCPWCMEPFPRVPHGHPQQAHSRVFQKRGIWHNRSSSFQISKNLKKSPTILIVISYNLKPVKISCANGRVSVRIFYKNNLISFRF